MRPWITEEAINFLDYFFQQNPHTRMLEFGSGDSTIWFAQRVQELVSIEHDIRWHDTVCHACTTQDLNHVTLQLVSGDYGMITEQFPDNYFDVIFIDGKDRVQCALGAPRILRSDGILMLDGAERRRYAPLFTLFDHWPCTISEHYKLSKHGDNPTLSKTAWWKKP